MRDERRRVRRENRRGSFGNWHVYIPLANAMGCISIAATPSDEAEILAFL